jgi:hypothetical protein
MPSSHVADECSRQRFRGGLTEFTTARESFNDRTGQGIDLRGPGWRQNGVRSWGICRVLLLKTFCQIRKWDQSRVTE